MSEDSSKGKMVKRFEPRVIKGGKGSDLKKSKSDSDKDRKSISASELQKEIKGLDPEKVKEFDKVINALFKSIQSDESPKMFQCDHCGGFHSFDINCSVCKNVSKAQQAFTMDRIDRMFAFAMCKKCLAVSIAIFQCHGIDPMKNELQKEYVENLKMQKVDDSDDKR